MSSNEGVHGHNVTESRATGAQSRYIDSEIISVL